VNEAKENRKGQKVFSKMTSIRPSVETDG